MSVCPICNGNEFWFEDFVDDEGIKRSHMVICSCKIVELKKEYKNDCGLSPHLQEQTFKNFDLSFYEGERKAMAINALNASKTFAADFIAGKKPDGLMFLGGVGSGKTYLASAIANAIMDTVNIKKLDKTVRFIVIPDFLDEIRASYKDDSSLREEEIMAKVRNAPLLIFDDLGTDNSSDFAVRVIFGTLNHRINYNLPTIITTNLNHKQIEAVYGSRIYSRLTGLCEFYPLEANKDIRLAKRIRIKKELRERSGRN